MVKACLYSSLDWQGGREGRGGGGMNIDTVDDAGTIREKVTNCPGYRF